MAKAENWRSVPGYPDIEISDELVVRSKARTTEYDHSLWGRQTRCFPSKVLTTQKQHKDGYLTVFVNSVRRPVGLHVIVCAAFHGASPAGKPYALHRDGNPANCAPGNLYWGDHADNARDALAHGVIARGEGHGKAKLTDDAVRVIRSETGQTRALAKKFGVSATTIRQARIGATWAHI